MARRVAIYILVSAVASIAATVAATWLYGLLVFGEPVEIAGSFLLGLQLGLRGLLVAAPAALVFGLVRPRVSRTMFVFAISAASAALGALLGLWSVGHSPHISTRIASTLLASTWGIAACSIGLLSGQSPNSRLHRT